MANKTSDEAVVLRTKEMKQKGSKKLGRRISCKDLGKGDCQGFLWKKKRSSRGIGPGNKWVKRWFVLKSRILYYYRDPDDEKAEGLISLPGYQVSPSPEVKTKKFAFKLHLSGTTFLLASERQDDMSKWMNKMGLAAIDFTTPDNIKTGGFTRPGAPQPIPEGYHSESDEESEDCTLKDEVDGARSSDTSSLSSINDDPLHKSNNSPTIPQKSYMPVSQGTASVSPGSSPTRGRRKATVAAPDVKIVAVTEDEKSNILGKEIVQLRPKSDESQEDDLSKLCHSLLVEKLSIDGVSVDKKRMTYLDKKPVAAKDPDEIFRVRKLKSLERTLRDKESDLNKIEKLLAEQPSPERLKVFKKENPHLCGHSQGFMETDI